MSMSDDSTGFPPGNRDGRRPADPRRQRPRDADNWRAPDPRERYAANYDQYNSTDESAAQFDPYRTADRAASDTRGYYEDPRGGAPRDHGYASEGDTVADDPFGWEEPAADAGYDDLHRADHGSAASRGYDESMLRRLGRLDADAESSGSRERYVDEAYEADAHHASADDAGGYFSDPYASSEQLPQGRGAGDPTELHDRFFAADEADASGDDYFAQGSAEPAAARVYDFDAHKSAVRSYERPHDDDDSAFSWDDYEQESAPAAANPLRREPESALPEEDIDADFFDGEDESEYAEPEQPPRKSGRKALVAGVLVGAIAVGGGAAYVYKNFGDTKLASGQPPTLLADGSPTKESPKDPGGKEFPHGNKLIYDRLSGAPAAEPSRPTRVASTDAGDSDTGGIPGIVTTGPKPEAGTLEERIEAALKKAGKSSDTGDAAADSDNPDAPKAVRTLVVKPDGTVLPSTPSTAGVVTTTSISAPKPSVEKSEVGLQKPAKEVVEVTPRSTRSETAVLPPTPQAAPQKRPTRVAALPKERTPAPSTVKATSNPYFVQLAARKDQTAALAAFADLQQKYPSILSGLTPTIKKADLGDKGIWYRLWVGPMSSKDGAVDVCGRLKQAGLKSCFVRSE